METKLNVGAKNITTYGGKGVLKEIWLPETIDEVVDIWRSERDVHILGGGSNTLILDGECRNNVVSFKRLNDVRVDGNLVTVGAGAYLNKVVSVAREYGLGGLEFMLGVPATIGGLVRMNAGAFGQEIGVYVDKIVSLNADNEIIEYYAPFDFGYRQGFQGVAVEVSLRLDHMTKDRSIALEKQYNAQRRSRQPKGRSTGSVFRNSQKSAGYYIDKVGLKGTRCGGAEISTLHGNFILNINDGTADDFLHLKDMAKTRVYEEFGVQLKEEFVLLGEI